ncbi:MAG: phosphoesterase [Acidimicrobiia bacterium]|nr:phosphoesterase [Acidimicrobiia bacterium]
MTLNLLYHDNCFDGASSAAVFLRFYRDKVNPRAEVKLVGMAHQAGEQFHAGLFDAEENAIVDFKYCSLEQLTWWFDHHHSAFLTPRDERHFREDRSGRKFYDPSYKSCTKLLDTIARQQFGFDCPGLSELVYWADIIDGALYRDARTAVEVGEPAQKLAAVIEASHEPDFRHEIIRRLAGDSLNRVANGQDVMTRYEPIARQHAGNIRIIRDACRLQDAVLFFDLVGTGMDGYNKFIPYYLHPEANYTVSLMQSPKRMKVGVGWNPWSKAERKHNLAAICERYGGGGHPVVAAISFEASAVAQARTAAEEIVKELRRA